MDKSYTPRLEHKNPDTPYDTATEPRVVLRAVLKGSAMVAVKPSG